MYWFFFHHQMISVSSTFPPGPLYARNKHSFLIVGNKPRYGVGQNLLNNCWGAINIPFPPMLVWTKKCTKGLGVSESAAEVPHMLMVMIFPVKNGRLLGICLNFDKPWWLAMSKGAEEERGTEPIERAAADSIFPWHPMAIHATICTVPSYRTRICNIIHAYITTL